MEINIKSAYNAINFTPIIMDITKMPHKKSSGPKPGSTKKNQVTAAGRNSKTTPRKPKPKPKSKTLFS